MQTIGELHKHRVRKCHHSGAGLPRKHAMPRDALCLLRRNQHGECAPQEFAEVKPIEQISAGTRPVLLCVVRLLMTRCGRHHNNIASAYMLSPCNLGLTRLLSYITKMIVWHAMLRPNVSARLHCAKISQRDLAPAPASRDAFARPQQRLDSGTAIVSFSTYLQEAVENWKTMFKRRAH